MEQDTKVYEGEVGLARKLFDEAKRYIPGGVNSPVRSFKVVGGYPVFVKQGKGSKIYGECGREFVDYCLSWGTLILGHAHPEVTEALGQAIRRGISFGTATKLETELARLIVEAVPSIEQVRLTNSGTEAVMGAIRVARAYTKKAKIIKFEGSYHGHADYLLVKAGSGASTLGIPDSLGVPEDFTKHTIVLPYNDLKRAEQLLNRQHKDIAAIILEPVCGNMGVVLPKPGFLKGLRAICGKYKIVLIFDEVITGFRLSSGGAQGIFGIRPDLTCLGKIIGGGLPIGAYGGRSQIMELVAPLGGVYQAGTLSGNPIACTAGIATLKILAEYNPYGALEEVTQRLCDGIRQRAEDYNIKLKINSTGSMFSVFFTDDEVADYKRARAQDIDLFKRFYHGLLKEGVYLSPSGFESNFVSTSHTAEDIEKTLTTVCAAFKKLRR